MTIRHLSPQDPYDLRQLFRNGIYDDVDTFGSGRRD